MQQQHMIQRSHWRLFFIIFPITIYKQKNMYPEDQLESTTKFIIFKYQYTHNKNGSNRDSFICQKSVLSKHHFVNLKAKIEFPDDHGHEDPILCLCFSVAIHYKPHVPVIDINDLKARVAVNFKYFHGYAD